MIVHRSSAHGQNIVEAREARLRTAPCACAPPLRFRGPADTAPCASLVGHTFGILVSLETRTDAIDGAAILYSYPDERSSS